MNRRQLKKISKKVAKALKILGHENFYFGRGEYWICFEYAGYEWDHLKEKKDALSVLWDWFYDSITIKNSDDEDDEMPEIIVYPKGFNSLSEINQIHFMINALKAA